MMEINEKLDKDYLALAKFWGQRRSKDPNKKVGAVLVRPDNSVAALCYNGFPRQMKDLPEEYADRDVKLSKIVHAEMNALLMARDQDLEGCTLYTWPLPCCDRCAPHVIQAGIRRVVAPDVPPDSKWVSSIAKSMEYFDEAGVYISLYAIEGEE